MDNKKRNETLSWKGSFIKINKKSLLALILAIPFFVVLGIRNSNRESSLIERGIKAKAFIYSIKPVGGKGIIRSFYKFNVNGVQYEGFVDNENYSVGDSITIIYNDENQLIIGIIIILKNIWNTCHEPKRSHIPAHVGF